MREPSASTAPVAEKGQGATLEIAGLEAGYGETRVLHGLTLSAASGG